MDTFQFAGREWADPAVVDREQENADEVFDATLTQLVATVDLRKVFYIQIGDAELPLSPMDTNHPWNIPGRPERMGWSRNARTFAKDPDVPGYLPVVRCAEAILKQLQYTGLVSCEVFSRFLFESDPEIAAKFAKRAAWGWHELLHDDLGVDPKA